MSNDWIGDNLGPSVIQADGEEVTRSRKLNLIGATSVEYNATTGAIDITLQEGGGGSANPGVETLVTLRAIALADRTDKERRTVNEDASDLANPQPAGFVYIEDQGANVADDGVNVIKPNDVLLASAGRWYRDPQTVTITRRGVMSPTDKSRLDNVAKVFNVRDYGADGLDGTGNSAAVESAAIQAAIDAAAAADFGGVIFFPAGHYRIDGHTLTMRRTVKGAALVYRGEGWGATGITNATGIVFDVEDMTANPDATMGGYYHAMEQMNLVTAGDYCVRWDNGFINGDGVRPQLHFYRMAFANTNYADVDGSPTSFAVKIVHGFRCRATECILDSTGSFGGSGWWELDHTSMKFTACNQLSPGAFVDAVDGGELVYDNCRCEGAWMIPAWKHVNCDHITFNHVANEGKVEVPAVALFDTCTSITFNQFGLATTDLSYILLNGGDPLNRPNVTFNNGTKTITRAAGDWTAEANGGFQNGQVVLTGSASNPGPFTITGVSATQLTCAAATFVNEGPVNVYVQADVYADGIQFIACDGVYGTVYSPGSFHDPGDGSAVALRFDSACRDMDLYSTGGSDNLDVDIDGAAVGVHVLWSNPDTVATYFLGSRRCNELVASVDLKAPTAKIDDIVSDAASNLRIAPTGVRESYTGGVGGQRFESIYYDSGATRTIQTFDKYMQISATTGNYEVSTVAAGTAIGLFAKGAVVLYSNLTTPMITLSAAGSAQFFGASTDPGAGVIVIADGTAPAGGTSNSEVFVYDDGGDLKAKCGTFVTVLAEVTPASRVNQLTDSTGGNTSSNGGALVDVGAVPSQANCNDNFAKLAAKINALETIIHNRGISQ